MKPIFALLAALFLTSCGDDYRPHEDGRIWRELGYMQAQVAHLERRVDSLEAAAAPRDTLRIDSVTATIKWGCAEDSGWIAVDSANFFSRQLGIKEK